MKPIAAHSESAASGEKQAGRGISRRDLFSAAAGLVALALAVVGYLFGPALTDRFGSISPDRSYRLFDVRFSVVLAGGFLVAFCLAPALESPIQFLRRHWRSAYTYGALLAICAFLCGFLIHFGRWQFGGYDFSILVETGWRQSLGQRPYVDFPTTTPPGFNLGVKYAYELFGVSWDATLYFSAVFACVTFLWMYALMVRLSMGRLPSMAIAFAIECAGMLTLCFWWYNDSVLILAAVFFLSCLLYARKTRSILSQISYFVSLTLLSLMKPNIAGLAIAGGVVLLFLSTERKMRLVLLTLGAAVAAVGLLLVNHVSIPAMLTSYLSVGKEHGGLLARFGYNTMTRFDRHSALLWICLLSISLLGLVPRWVALFRERAWKEFVFTIFFPLSLLIAIYGLATNGEYRDVDCTLLLAAGAVLTFGLRWNGPVLRRFYIAIVCASMAGDLYYGASRARVYGIGQHAYFEWENNQHHIEGGYLKNMRVSSTMIEVEREVRAATDENPAPYFFGPRMELNYSVLGLLSPEHLPAWWEPGTAFGVSQQGHLIQVWKEHQFQTLIFLKTDSMLGSYEADGFDYAFYPKEFRKAIAEEYSKDERYPLITVYHRRTMQ